MLRLIGFYSRLVTTAQHFQEQNQINIIELPHSHSPETHSRGLVTTLKCRLRVGSNLFALGPPIDEKGRPSGGLFSLTDAGEKRTSVATKRQDSRFGRTQCARRARAMDGPSQFIRGNVITVQSIRSPSTSTSSTSLAPDGGFTLRNAARVAAISYGVTGRFTFTADKPAPANIIGTKVS